MKKVVFYGIAKCANEKGYDLQKLTYIGVPGNMSRESVEVISHGLAEKKAIADMESLNMGLK